MIKSIRPKSLFYPSCGADLATPIERFQDDVDRFWFVDTRRLCRKDFSRLNGISMPERTGRQLLNGATLLKKEGYTVSVETYVCFRETDGRALEINLCMGRGYDAFRSIFDDRGELLSTFFYRGDSAGESGSGFNWLRKGWGRLENVLERLTDGGLVVSDGSNACRELRQFLGRTQWTPAQLEDLAASIKPFRIKNYSFTCVGTVGVRYGPTLIWRVIKLAS